MHIYGANRTWDELAESYEVYKKKSFAFKGYSSHLFLLKSVFKCRRCSGAEVGDACNEDFDGDGFPDSEDSCPHIDNIHKTSFLHHFIVWLDGQSTTNDVWKISNEVFILSLI